MNHYFNEFSNVRTAAMLIQVFEDHSGLLTSGISSWAVNLWLSGKINYQEFMFVTEVVEDNIPKKVYNNSFYFKPKCVIKRIDYLRKHITNQKIRKWNKKLELH